MADVIVVGAGPTGLMLAAELALAGVDVEVLERLERPDLTPKGASIRLATAEALDRRGLAAAIRASHRRAARTMNASTPGPSRTGLNNEEGSQIPVGGHFAGMAFASEQVDHSDPELRAHLAAADAIRVPQRDLEEILTAHALAHGVTIRRGTEVADLDQNPDSVTLETSQGPRTARWVIGADGGRSTIRRLLNIEFPGTDGEVTGYQAIAEVNGDEGLRRGWAWTPRGVYSYGPQPGRIISVRFDGSPADRSLPVTAKEVQDSLRHISATEVTVAALHGTATRWTDNARHASTYRRGRVLLAGDAAHVHSPFGGQGINLGIGDAMNLGFKLAAVVHGRAEERLLDTYEAERRPIAEWVLEWTRGQVALMRGDEKTGALRQVIERHLLSMTSATTAFVALTSGICQRYAVGKESPSAEVTVASDDEPGIPGARLGRLVGDVALGDGGWLADRAHQGTFVLLDQTAEGEFASVTEPWGSQVTVVRDDGTGPKGLLVRPDGCVAWVSGPGSDALDVALQHWAGRPE